MRYFPYASYRASSNSSFSLYRTPFPSLWALPKPTVSAWMNHRWPTQWWSRVFI
jgi:hypothetical protein